MSGYTYVGRASCGCIRMARVDETAHPADVGDCLRDAVRNGLTIERWPTQQVREMEWRCKSDTCPYTKERAKAIQGALL